MGMFDLTVERAFDKDHIEADERAVAALLKPQAISYIRDLSETINKDPSFLTFHDRSVSLKIQSLLSRQGIFWDEEVFERRFLRVVMGAVTQLRYLEK